MRRSPWIVVPGLVLAAAAVGSAAHALTANPAQPLPRPVPVYAQHKLVLTRTGQLYLRLEKTVGKPDYTPGWEVAAVVDFAQLFPTVQSFDAFNLLSESQKEAALAAAGTFALWDQTFLTPADILAEATILLDVSETDYSVLQTQFEDHVGAMAEAWSTALRYPFSAAAGAAVLEAPIGLGQAPTEESWAAVKEYAGKVASGAWNAGKWVAKKVLPVAQAAELCVTAANVIGTSIESGEPPAWEDIGELCFDALECIPGGWGVGAAVAHEAWCWISE